MLLVQFFTILAIMAVSVGDGKAFAVCVALLLICIWAL